MRQRAVEELSGRRKRRSCIGVGVWAGRISALLESAGDKLRRGKAFDRAVRRSHHVEEAERLLRLGLEQLALERSALAG